MVMLKVRKKKIVVRPKPLPKRLEDRFPPRDINGARIVLQHPELKLIVEWFRDGNSAAYIARYMVTEGMIMQSERTFCDYLLSFKRVYPDHLKSDNPLSLDSIVNANMPALNVDKELHRIYRVQKVRLALGVQEEIKSGRLMKDRYKEISAAHDVLQTVAKIEGRMSANSHESRLQQYPPEVREDLIAIRQEEESYSRMRTVTTQFINAYEKQSDIEREAFWKKVRNGNIGLHPTHP